MGYIHFPIKRELVSGWLHKLICLETGGSQTAAAEELYNSQAFVRVEKVFYGLRHAGGSLDTTVHVVIHYNPFIFASKG